MNITKLMGKSEFIFSLLIFRQSIHQECLDAYLEYQKRNSISKKNEENIATEQNNPDPKMEDNKDLLNDDKNNKESIDSNNVNQVEEKIEPS